MFLSLAGEFQTLVNDIVSTTKMYLTDFWNAFHGFLSQYMADNVINLFIGMLLLAIVLFAVLALMNRK